MGFSSKPSHITGQFCYDSLYFSKDAEGIVPIDVIFLEFRASGSTLLPVLFCASVPSVLWANFVACHILILLFTLQTSSPLDFNRHVSLCTLFPKFRPPRIMKSPCMVPWVFCFAASCAFPSSRPSISLIFHSFLTHRHASSITRTASTLTSFQPR